MQKAIQNAGEACVLGTKVFGGHMVLWCIRKLEPGDHMTLETLDSGNILKTKGIIKSGEQST